LNIWRVLRNLFVGFGVIFLALDALTAYSVAYGNSYFASISLQTALHLLIGPLTPYATIASFMFVIAAVSSYAAKTSSFALATSSGDGKPLAQPKSLGALASETSKEYPAPQVSTCPHCRQTIVFMEQYQKWYCLKEKRYI